MDFKRIIIIILGLMVIATPFVSMAVYYFSY